MLSERNPSAGVAVDGNSIVQLGTPPSARYNALFVRFFIRSLNVAGAPDAIDCCTAAAEI